MPATNETNYVICITGGTCATTTLTQSISPNRLSVVSYPVTPQFPINVPIPLDEKIPQAVKENIWAKQYVELASLVDPDQWEQDAV